MKVQITQQQGRLVLSGKLDYQTIPAIYQASLPLLATCSRCCFDFSAVEPSTNSAALALMLEWVKYAKKLGKPVEFQQVSKELLTVASIAGIEGILKQ